MTTDQGFLDTIKVWGNNTWLIIKPFIPFIIPMFLIEGVKSKIRKRTPKEQFYSFLIGTCTSIGCSKVVFYYFHLDSEIFRTFINCFIYAWAENFWIFIINISITKEVMALIRGTIKSIGDSIKNKLK